MNNVLEVLMKMMDIFKKFSIDIEKLPDGRLKICIIVDPKELIKK